MKNIKTLVIVGGIAVSATFLVYNYLDVGRDSEVLVTSTQGYGDSEQSAIDVAKKNAIGQVCGETLLGSTRTQKETQKNTKINSSGENSKTFNSDSNLSDENLLLVGGSIKSFTVKSRKQENGIYYVEIEAKVVDCKKGDAVSEAISGGGNGLINNPKNISEKYSNARLLAQRGESDRSLKIYEQLLEEKIIYVDPIEDMVLLARKLYGNSGAHEYIKSTFERLKGKPEYYFALLKASDQPLSVPWDIVLKSVDTFPPLSVAYLDKHEEDCRQKYSKDPFEYSKCQSKILSLENIEYVVSSLEKKRNSGVYSNYFLDINRSSDSSFRWTLDYINDLSKNSESMAKADKSLSKLNDIMKKRQDAEDAKQNDLKNRYPNFFKD